MIEATGRWTAALVLVTLLGTACASSGATAPPAGPSSMTAAEMEAIYRAREDSARARVSPADVRFMTDMIHHHAQALQMARMAPSHDASPAIRRLAARILSGQEDELETMRSWLRERGRPVPDVDGGEPVDQHSANDAHPPGHAGAEGAMPGMLTPAQLAELHAARGAEFDRLFLTSMIQHHRGAVAMVHQLFATEGAGQDDTVFKFASDVQVDQTTEIARMELMLRQMGTGAHTH